MEKSMVSLWAVYQDMLHRHGSDDPMVIALKTQMEERPASNILPFGERRKTRDASPLMRTPDAGSRSARLRG